MLMSDIASGLAHSRIHRALSRPSLLLGADRELVLLTGLVSAILIFVVLTWYAVISGIVLWLFIVAALRAMANADPLMRRVYLRHVSYRAAYRATSTPWLRY